MFILIAVKAKSMSDFHWNYQISGIYVHLNTVSFRKVSLKVISNLPMATVNIVILKINIVIHKCPCGACDMLHVVCFSVCRLLLQLLF